MTNAANLAQEEQQKDAASGAANYSVRVIRNLEELETVRPLWERLQNNLNADIDYFVLILKSRPEILRPHVLVLHVDGVPTALVVGRLEQSRRSFQLGYAAIARPLVKAIVLPHGRLLGHFPEQAARLIVHNLLESLRKTEADLVLLSNAPVQSPVSRAMGDTAPFALREHFIPSQRHWLATLPETVDQFLAEHYWPRRLPRRLEKQNPGQVRFVCFKRPDEIERFCIDAETVAAKAYQRALNSGFHDSAEMRARLTLVAERGLFRGFVLYVREVPWAFWTGTAYKGVFHSDSTAYDPAFAKEEPGTTVFSLMVQHLIKDGTRKLDFGLGDAFYKERFGTEHWEEATAFLFAPTAKALTLNVLASTSNLVGRAGRWVLRSSHALSRLKKAWRTKLRKENNRREQS